MSNKPNKWTLEERHAAFELWYLDAHPMAQRLDEYAMLMAFSAGINAEIARKKEEESKP